jgi:hypothetical protein
MCGNAAGRQYNERLVKRRSESIYKRNRQSARQGCGAANLKLAKLGARYAAANG